MAITVLKEDVKPGKDESADGDEEDEKEELLEAVLQSVGDRLQARGMPNKGTTLQKLYKNWDLKDDVFLGNDH